MCRSRKTLQLALLIIRLEQPQDVRPASEIIDLLRSEAALLQHTLQTAELLVNITLIRAELLKDLNVIVLVFALSALSHLLRLLDTLVPLALEFIDDLIQRLDSTACSVETAADSAVRARLLVKEGNKRRLGAATLVVDGLGAALGEELDGRVRFDALVLGGSLGVGGFGIDLCDEDGGLELIILGERLPDGSEALAVCRTSSSASASLPHQWHAVRLERAAAGTYVHTTAP